jgi:hypothetical protein
LAVALGFTGACAGGDENRRVVPSYDTFTGQLVQLMADQNGDGRIDQWSYLDGQRPLRGEADTDGDGRIDRWEYFAAGAALTQVGTSSRNDGVEDTWTMVEAIDGERQVARSRKRDRQIDRREYFRDDTMVRAEDDTNADGLADKWDRYEGTVLREVRLDTSLQAGRPDRRLLYDAKGRFEAIETDPERDGAYVRRPGPAPVNQPGVVR